MEGKERAKEPNLQLLSSVLAQTAWHPNSLTSSAVPSFAITWRPQQLGSEMQLLSLQGILLQLFISKRSECQAWLSQARRPQIQEVASVKLNP